MCDHELRRFARCPLQPVIEVRSDALIKRSSAVRLVFSYSQLSGAVRTLAPVAVTFPDKN